MRIIDADLLECDTEWDEYEDGFTAYSRVQIECAPSIETKQVKYYDEDENVWKIGEVIDRKTEPTISKKEQVDTMSCQECKHFHENAVMYLDQCDFCFKDCKYEPKGQTEREGE